MGVNSLPKTVIRQRRGYDLNPGPSAPESCTLSTRLLSYPSFTIGYLLAQLFFRFPGISRFPDSGLPVVCDGRPRLMMSIQKAGRVDK